MRLSWSLAFNGSADFLFRSGASSKESSSALSSLPLERKKAFSSLSQEIKKDGIKPVIFYLPWMRFERMTYRLEGGCSIQLSYQGLLFNSSMKIFLFKSFLFIKRASLLYSDTLLFLLFYCFICSV